MAIIIECPNEVYSLENERNKKVFLAGGITDCPDWQTELLGMLEHVNGITIYNPRRLEFDITNKSIQEEQVTWEYVKLRQATVMSFWFSSGSYNPISLYELGMWGTSRNIPLVVGIDPDYIKKSDVIEQVALARPDVKIVFSLEDLSNEIIKITR